MKHLAGLGVALASVLTSFATPATGKAPPTAMWRLDCGTYDIDNLEGRGRVLMPVSCYLIRHGSHLVMFDAGLDAKLYGKPVREREQTLRLDHKLQQQLTQIGVDPAKVETLIVSHDHGDHHGQADIFPNARLVIGAADAAAMRKAGESGALAPWLDGKRPVTEVGADLDLRGDGSLVALFTPGHTPGHLSLLVRLGRGRYILSGDLVHSRSQLATMRPSGNHVDKERGRAEIERVLRLADEKKAMIIVGHDQGDIALLPSFPVAAK